MKRNVTTSVTTFMSIWMHLGAPTTKSNVARDAKNGNNYIKNKTTNTRTIIIYGRDLHYLWTLKKWLAITNIIIFVLKLLWNLKMELWFLIGCIFWKRITRCCTVRLFVYHAYCLWWTNVLWKLKNGIICGIYLQNACDAYFNSVFFGFHYFFVTIMLMHTLCCYLFNIFEMISSHVVEAIHTLIYRCDVLSLGSCHSRVPSALWLMEFFKNKNCLYYVWKHLSLLKTCLREATLKIFYMKNIYLSIYSQS